MKKLNIHFIPDLLRWKISIRWSTVVIHLLAVPCTVVPIAASLNLSHSDATAVSALPAETSIPWNALLPCLLNLLMSSTATVFLLLMKIFVTFFLKTVLCSTASFTLLPVSSLVCSSKWTSLKIIHLVLLWYYILLAGIENGIPTSTVLYRKVVTVMMDSGVRSTTSIILICVMLSAQHCLMKWDADSDLLSKK